MRLLVKWFLDKLLRHPFMKKLPSVLRQFRRRGKYRSVRRSQVFRHRLHAFWTLFGARMVRPSAILSVRDALSKRVHDYLALVNFQRNLLRKQNNLQQVSLRQYLDTIFGDRLDKEGEKRTGELFDEVQRNRRLLKLLKEEIRSNFLFLSKEARENEKRLKPSNFRFLPKPRLLRKNMLSLFKHRKFRRRNLNRIQRKARVVFKFKLSPRHRIFFYKILFLRNRRLLARKVRQTVYSNRRWKVRVFLRNRKLLRKFKRKVARMRARHVVIQRLKVAKARSQGRFHRWAPFKVKRKWKYKLHPYPRKNIFLTKLHYDGLYRLKKLRKAQYKGLVKMIPYFVLVARKRPTIFVKAGLRQIFRSIPIFARFISAARVPHNGIRKKKVRRM